MPMRLSRRLASVGVVLFLTALWFLPDIAAWFGRKPDEAWARVQQNGVIRFAINPTCMPFDGRGSHGDFFGIDVDIANDLARRLGKYHFDRLTHTTISAADATTMNSLATTLDNYNNNRP